MNTQLQRLLAILGLAALVVLPVRADDDHDDLYDDDDVTFTVGERLTAAQKLELKLAEKSAEYAAKAAEKSAKLAAAAAERAARRASQAVRDLVKADGKYKVELAGLGDEQAYLAALEEFALRNAIDLAGLPAVEEILVRLQEEAVADAEFYRSLIPLGAADRAAALALRNAERAVSRDEILSFMDTLNELQVMVVEATAELADELVDVADAYVEWQDKLALSQLSPTDYAAERARRAAAERARKAELMALPRASQVWLRKAWEAEEDAAELAAALERLQN